MLVEEVEGQRGQRQSKVIIIGHMVKVNERYKRKLSCHQLDMLELNEGKMNN